jgi:hypothetical protein
MKKQSIAESFSEQARALMKRPPEERAKRMQNLKLAVQAAATRSHEETAINTIYTFQDGSEFVDSEVVPSVKKKAEACRLVDNYSELVDDRKAKKKRE